MRQFNEYVRQAYNFAAAAHENQKRKYTNEPYMVHPEAVYRILLDYNSVDEQMLIAALLHDTIEDTYVEYYNIEEKFGEEIANLVFELSEPIIENLNRRARKALEANRLSKVSARAQTIKYADLIDNTISIVKYDKKFAIVYLKEKETLLESMVKGDSKLRTLAWKSLNDAKKELEKYYD